MSQSPPPLDPDQSLPSELEVQSEDRLRQYPFGNHDRHIAASGNIEESAIVSGDGNIVVVGGNYVQAASVPRSSTEQNLLNQVKAEVDSRLQQSLHNAVFINLGKDAQPQQVVRPWDAEVKIGATPPQALPKDITILQVFDRPDIAGRLLILGEPGAGKTTTLLDLAKGLCDRAETDATYFIPVLVNLSSRKDPEQTMTDWLVEELKSKYGVRKDIGKRWLTEKQLLPLLDGLDEVKPEHQKSCVQAINHWLKGEESPPFLAVCCRQEEYEEIVRGRWQEEVNEQWDKTRIQLNGAILLQALTDEQIEAYLAAADQSELWKLLQQDEELWKLVRTPLWLSITLLSYEELPLSQWRQTASAGQRLTLLMDAYVERMLHRELRSEAFTQPKPPPAHKPLKLLMYIAGFSWLCSQKPPTAKKTRQWLTYLADQLEQDSLTEFLIEKMQPAWLDDQKKRYYRRCFNLVWIAICTPLWYMSHEVAMIVSLDVATKSGKTSTSDLLIILIYTYFGVLLFAVALAVFFLHPLGDSILILSKLSQFWKVLKRFAVYAAGLGILIGMLKLVAGSSLAEAFYTSLSAILIVFSLILSVAFFVLTANNLNARILHNIKHTFRGFRLYNELNIEDELYTEIIERRVPNQEVRIARNNLIKSVVTGTLFSCAIFVCGLLQHGTHSESLWRVLGLHAIIGAYIGILFGMQLGGLGLIQHIALRKVLYCNGFIPCNYARFLNYCTERLFLQKVGGRYRFIHKYLQEHLAAMRN